MTNPSPPPTLPSYKLVKRQVERVCNRYKDCIPRQTLPELITLYPSSANAEGITKRLLRNPPRLTIGL
jgi:hypothetical protein